jgi:hypothetical protein
MANLRDPLLIAAPIHDALADVDVETDSAGGERYVKRMTGVNRMLSG